MILFISHDAYRAGAPISLLHILKWLRKNTDLQFEILLKQGGELQEDFASIAPTYVCLRGRDWLRRTKEGKRASSPRAPRSLDRNAYSLIYSNTVTNGPLILSTFSDKIPLVTHCHEMDYWISRANFNSSDIRRSRSFIACSNPSAHSLVKRGVPREAIEVIPEPFCPSPEQRFKAEYVRRNLGIPEDSFVVTAGGAEGWRKGKDLFVQLAALLQGFKKKRFDLIWLGSENEAEFEYWLHASTRYSGATSNVHWPGPVTDPLAYFDAANVFALLSREDPMPLMAIEAASRGLPIICFKRAGGTADWVKEAKGGYLAEYLNVGQVAEIIARYSSEPRLAQRHGSNAQFFCSENFSIERIGPRILKVIERYMS